MKEQKGKRKHGHDPKHGLVGEDDYKKIIF